MSNAKKQFVGSSAIAGLLGTQALFVPISAQSTTLPNMPTQSVILCILLRHRHDDLRLGTMCIRGR